jgi:N-acetyl-gamma-glutamyl-phosphate reductase
MTSYAVAILGASGYTGAELVRLLALHPNMTIKALTADRRAGQQMASVFPHLAGLDLPALVKIEDVQWDEIDAVFCALPHAMTQEVVKDLPRHLKIVDLSADFRLRNLDTYQQWYGRAHLAPDMQPEAVYGLTEHAKDTLATARLVANPGCFPTSALLPLLPLLAAEQILDTGIIIDAKSGVSGAGRAPKEGTLHCEVSEGIHAYSVSQHRHAPEIEQELSKVHGKDVYVTFTPHLVPMNRGILSTIYVQLADGVQAEDLQHTLAARYQDEPFVQVLAFGAVPQTRHVKGSNLNSIGVVADRVPGRAIIVSAIDNLVKGASGQAVHNMNVMLGLPEHTALQQYPMFP